MARSSRIRKLTEDADLLIFDADGTLRRTTGKHKGAPRGPGDWELLPRVRETFAQLDLRGVRVGIATNQPAVSDGEISLRMARRILDDLLDTLGVPSATRFVQICPHDKKTSCVCKKPSPGMIVRILDASGTAPDRALMIGNAAADRRTARRAGVRYEEAGVFFGRTPRIAGTVKGVVQTVTPV